MATTLPLTAIRLDGHTQSRVAVLEDVVRDYADEYRAKTAMPPLVVFYDGKDYWLADGFHRFKAAQQAKMLTIRCDIKRGGREAAAWHSVGANRSHGLRRTTADKQNAVRMALELHPERSNRSIAEHVGVHHDMVATTRRQVEDSSTSARVGKDGKHYPPSQPRRHEPTASAGQPAETPPPSDPPPPEDAPEAPPPAAEPPPPMPPEPPDEPPAADNPDQDARGEGIPPERLALWNRGQEIQDMLTALSRIKGALQKGQDLDDPLLRPVNFSCALANLSQARAAIEVALRRYVCPMCHGDGCNLCKDTGLLGQFAWDTFVPREFKL